MIFYVDGQTVKAAREHVIPTNSVEFIPVVFELPEEWKGLYCTVEFEQTGKEPIPKYIGADRETAVPAGLIAGSVNISIWGVDANGGSKRGTTIPATVTVSDSGIISTEEDPVEPPESLYAQIIYTVKNLSLADVNTNNLAEGNINKYHTEQRVVDIIKSKLPDTDSLPEGANNKYYPSVDKAKLAGIEEHASALPDKTGITNKILSINDLGVLEWVANVIGLPSMSGNNGKILTTDGNTANWSNAINGYLQAIGFIGSSLQNAGGTNYGYISLGSGGVAISRNQADDKSAFTVNQINAASTGDIASFQFQGALKAQITRFGAINAQTLSAWGSYLQIQTPATPASATDTGAKGQIKWDANNLYVCTDTNVWKQTALKPVGQTGNLELIEKIIVGYTIMAEQPADWATNWTNYYTNTGTAIEPIYTAVSGASAPTWQANTYYSFDPNGVAEVIRSKDTLGNDYNFIGFADHIVVPSVASGAGQFSRRVHNMGTVYNPSVVIGGGSRGGSTVGSVNHIDFIVYNLLGFWKSILNYTSPADTIPYYNGADYSPVAYPRFSVIDYPAIKLYKLALNGASIIPSLTEIEIWGVRA